MIKKISLTLIIIGISLFIWLLEYVMSIAHGILPCNNPVLIISCFMAVLLLSMDAYLAASWKDDLLSKTKVVSVHIVGCFLLIGWIYLPFPLTSSYINESITIKDIAHTIAPEAARAANPEEYAQEAVRNLLVEKGQDPNKYTVEVTLPNGYEYQKPLNLKITSPIEANTIARYILGDHLEQSATELLNGPNALKTTLDKAKK